MRISFPSVFSKYWERRLFHCCCCCCYCFVCCCCCWGSVSPLTSPAEGHFLPLCRCCCFCCRGSVNALTSPADGQFVCHYVVVVVAARVQSSTWRPQPKGILFRCSLFLSCCWSLDFDASLSSNSLDVFKLLWIVGFFIFPTAYLCIFCLDLWTCGDLVPRSIYGLYGPNLIVKGSTLFNGHPRFLYSTISLVSPLS